MRSMILVKTVLCFRASPDHLVYRGWQSGLFEVQRGGELGVRIPGLADGGLISSRPCARGNQAVAMAARFYLAGSAMMFARTLGT